MKAKTWIEISKEALTENVRVFREYLSETAKDPHSTLHVPRIMAVVKSNAYGHGSVGVAQTVESDVDWFGVDSVDEGITLREAGIKKPILILGYTLKDRLKDVAAHDLSMVVYNLDVVEALAKLNAPVNVHIKIETGTERQGVEGEKLRVLVKAISQVANIEVEGVYTHFANVEEDDAFPKEQLQRFNDALEILKEEGVEPKLRHAACTAAGFLLPEASFDLVRLGISLYGLWSSKYTKDNILRRTNGVGLAPALTWKTVVAQVKSVKKGAGVSYDLTEKVERDSKIAVIPVGYWDGYDRTLSKKGHVLIKGARCKVIGRVCMNMFMVDVTDVGEISPEEEVVLLGRQGDEEITAEELAEIVGTINYEIVTRINPLIPRILI